MNLLTKIFGTGGLSVMRMVTVFVIGNIMIVWSIDCIMSKHIVDIPTGVVAIFIGMVGAKALQNFAEDKAPPPPAA
jgi:hypothetical protein